MQCKDIPNAPILTWLAENTHEFKWATWFDLHHEGHMPTVRDCMPADVPPKLRLAKMRQLMKRGLVHGCGWQPG